MAPSSDSDSNADNDDENAIEPDVREGNINKKKHLLLDSSDDETSDDAGAGDAERSSSSSSGLGGERTKPGPILKVNQKYATEFERRKRREELVNARQAGEDDEGSDDDSSSEEEDEDAELLTPGLDLKIIRTIKALRSKDDSIYDREKRFFPARKDSSSETSDDDRNDQNGKSEIRNRKPMRYKDVIREQVLEQMEAEERGDGEKDSSGAEKLGSEEGSNRIDGEEQTSRLAYDEEQRELRAAFLKSTQGGLGDDEEEDEGDDTWMVKKSGERGNGGSDDDDDPKRLVRNEISELQNVDTGGADADISDPRGEVQNGDQFLFDFFKNKRWVDNTVEADNEWSNKKEAGMPEGVHDAEDDGHDSDASLDDIEQTDAFESKYNFRFEEAAAAAAESGAENGHGPSGAAYSVVGYARNATSDTLRRKDDSRRLKRLARKERKAAERKAKEERLRRLKNAKREEMESRLKQVRQVVGAAEGDEAEIDEAALMKLMEGDYDPEKFEQVMAKTYGDDFYEKEEAEWKTDRDVKDSLQKDEIGIESEIVEAGIYDDSNQEELENDGQEEDTGGEDWPLGDESATRDEFAEDHEEEERGDIEKKMKEKMMDELYKLDYEDIIGDMPTRFKYRKVEPNDYGLSAQEVLFAKDATLRQFVSLKKMAPYREGEEYQPGTKKRKRFRELAKQDYEEQLKEEGEAEESTSRGQAEEEQFLGKKKKRRRQKKGKKKDKHSEDVDASKAEVEKVHHESANKNAEDLREIPTGEKPGTTKRKRKKKGKKSTKRNMNNESVDGANSVNADDSKIVENRGKKHKKKTSY